MLEIYSTVTTPALGLCLGHILQNSFWSMLFLAPCAPSAGGQQHLHLLFEDFLDLLCFFFLLLLLPSLSLSLSRSLSFLERFSFLRFFRLEDDAPASLSSPPPLPPPPLLAPSSSPSLSEELTPSCHERRAQAAGVGTKVSLKQALVSHPKHITPVVKKMSRIHLLVCAVREKCGSAMQ